MGHRIAYLCDSTADFPAGMVKALNLHVIPVHIVADGHSYLHGVDIDNHTILKALKKKKKVFTKPFYPAECARYYDELLKNHDRIVSFHLSTHLSDNYNCALRALKLLSDQDARRITILDLSSVSISLGLMIKFCIELFEQGERFQSIEKLLPRLKNEAFMNFTVENLFWLKAGGRVSALGAMMGNLLDIKPIISLQDAKLVPTDKVRGKKKVLSRMVDNTIEKYGSLKGNGDIWISYAGNLNEVITTREILSRRLDKPADDIKLVELGATIAIHAGPGSVSIGMFPRLGHA